MVKKCFLDDGNPFAGYAINEQGKKIALCAIHLIQMKQQGLEIVMKRGMPQLPDVDPSELHEWNRANLVGDNVWKCQRCDLEVAQPYCPSGRGYGGCAGEPVDWEALGMPINLKWSR